MMDVNLLREGKCEGCVQKGKIHHLETVCECVGSSASVGTSGGGTHWVYLRGPVAGRHHKALWVMSSAARAGFPH